MKRRHSGKCRALAIANDIMVYLYKKNLRLSKKLSNFASIIKGAEITCSKNTDSASLHIILSFYYIASS